MSVFFTCISHGKLSFILNRIYMKMQKVLNERLAQKDYGPGLEEWFLLFIMLPPGLPGHDSPERVLFKRKDKVFDLRLHISNEAFWKADDVKREALVVECMMRSLDLIATRKIPDFDIAALKADVATIVEEEGWGQVQEH